MSERRPSVWKWWVDALVVCATFVFVGWAASWAVRTHWVVHGTPAPEVRLASWMAWLFAGSAACVPVGILLLMRRNKGNTPQGPHRD